VTSEPTIYSCCFCNKGISSDEHSRSVLLTATNLQDYAVEDPDPRYQSFYAHLLCLQDIWKKDYAHPLEIEALTDTN